jgi:dolichol-phosphate mannosyltransferase
MTIPIVSVILPTYNESSNILPMIDRIHASLQNKEIIVVDDNSPDGTWEIASQVEGKDVRVIRRFEDKGLVPSIQRGIQEARGKYVVWMDADQSMPPEFISKLISELEINDIALGSRYVAGGRDLRPAVRLVTSRMINLAANIILNFKVRDYTSGFMAVRKEVFTSLKVPNAVYGEYCIDFLYTATKMNYKVKEVPYDFIDRLDGQSKTADSLLSLLKFGWVYGKRIINLRIK